MRERPFHETYKPYTLKPTPIPENFILLQDTREIRPLFPRIPKGLTIQSCTLRDGDYSIKGFESEICFERKASDIFAYCSSEREKTVAKMKRFQTYKFAGLVIELKETELYQFQQHTKVHPEVTRAALVSFAIRYGVHVYCGTRESCARYLLDHLVKYFNVRHEL